MKLRPIGLLVVIPILGLLTPHILGGIFLVSIISYEAIEKWRYPTNARFQTAHWQADQKFRYNVLKEVDSKIIKKGMIQAQVLATLGTPDSKPTAGAWQYDAEQPGWRFIDFHGGGFLVEFDSRQKVKNHEINYWVD